MQTCRATPLEVFLCGFMLLAVSLMGVGCRSAQQYHPFSPLPAEILPAGEHRLTPGEQITIRFPGGTNHTARIKEDGTINLPLVGDVRVAGKTYHELHVEFYALYVPRFYRPGTIPPPFEQRVYYVGGEVGSPGRLMYIDATTVTKAIQSAGSWTDLAARNRVELTRANGQKIEVNCIKATKDYTLDLPVYPGDKIFVPQRTFWDSFR